MLKRMNKYNDLSLCPFSFSTLVDLSLHCIEKKVILVLETVVIKWLSFEFKGVILISSLRIFYSFSSV